MEHQNPVLRYLTPVAIPKADYAVQGNVSLHSQNNRGSGCFWLHLAGKALILQHRWHTLKPKLLCA